MKISDITYTPYLEKSEVILKNNNLKIPKITHEYILTNDQIKNKDNPYPEVYKNPIKSNDFMSKMINLYTDRLKSKNIDPKYAILLAKQSALESNYGKSLSGKYNYGGIKSKTGTIKDTNEYIDRKYVKTKATFKDFDSDIDYIDYHIDLLNNSRYNAFSGDQNTFLDNIVKGGYATDPKYKEKILSMFQEGGKLNDPETKWLNNWLNNRKEILGKNVQSNNNKISYLSNLVKSDLKIGETELNNQLNSLKNTTVYNENEIPSDEHMDIIKNSVKNSYGDISNKSTEDILYYDLFGSLGYYNRNKSFIRLKDNSYKIHEYTHALKPDAQVKEIYTQSFKTPSIWKGIYKEKLELNKNSKPDNYLDSSNEIYARLMQFRHDNNIDPKKKYDYSDFKNMRNNKSIKDDNLLHRYSDEFLERLFNKVAKNKDDKKYQFAKNGIKLNSVSDTSNLNNTIEDSNLKKDLERMNWPLDSKNIKDSYKLLREFKVPHEQAVSMMGNYYIESGINPNIIEKNNKNKKGYGIYQATPIDRKESLKNYKHVHVFNGSDPELQKQISFVSSMLNIPKDAKEWREKKYGNEWKDYKGSGDKGALETLKRFNKIKDIPELTKIYKESFERPSNGELEERIKISKYFDNEFKNTKVNIPNISFNERLEELKRRMKIKKGK